MRKILWFAAGAAVTVYAIRKVTELSEKHSAVDLAARAIESVVDRGIDTATRAGNSVAKRASSVAGEMLTDFRTARDARELELASALLAETQGSVEELKARRSKNVKTLPDDEFAGDEEALGYEF